MICRADRDILLTDRQRNHREDKFLIFFNELEAEAKKKKKTDKKGCARERREMGEFRRREFSREQGESQKDQ